MQINSINKVGFGQLHLDKMAKECFQHDVCCDLKNVRSFKDYYNKLRFAENAPIDFFVNGNDDHVFRAVAINQKTGQYYARKENTSVHHVINDIIDAVKNYSKSDKFLL